MAKQKIYIFVTYNILEIGGTQMYIAGKANYLQKRGWKVYVFFTGSRKGKAGVPFLTQYLQTGGGMEFFTTPPYKLKNYEQEFCLNEMLQRLNLVSGEEYDIIIESHDDKFSYWAELLAARIGARHIFSCCNELYRSTPTISKTYEDNLDFFYFKWKRNEIFGRDAAFKSLFNGYKNVTAPLIEIPWTGREMDAIQDVDFPIEKIEKLDWNICHFGRTKKEYVPFVIEGVGELARRHPDKKINFIMIGDVGSRQSLLEKTLGNLPNVLVTPLGDMAPVPRILFSKVDVVCAISQSARFTANEGILTIVGNVDKPERTPGVLGYDTTKQMQGNAIFSYVDALENVLLKKLYDGKKSSLPKLEPADNYYARFLEIVDKTSPVKEYFAEKLSKERIRNWTAVFPFGSIARGSNIILYGETDIAKDYRKQIDSQKNSSAEFGHEYVKLLKPAPYCQIVATVDEHDEEFDNEVVGLNRLKAKNYDAIVLCCYPAQAQAAYEKIRQIVPDMAGKVVYNFQTVSV